MNIDNQIFYIIILVFACLVLLCITLMYLYITAINKYTNVRTAGLSEKDESVINHAKEIAEKIVNTAKKLDEKHDAIMGKIIADISQKWQKSADQIFSENAKTLDLELKKTVENIYKKETSSLESYKKEKIKEFDGLLSGYIEKIGKDILKKEINLEDHKNLISDGLERAKKGGLFN